MPVKVGSAVCRRAPHFCRRAPCAIFDRVPVSPTATSAIVEELGRLGIDVFKLGIGPIADDETLALLWARAIAKAGRRTLPFEVGQAMPLGSMGVVDYLGASSASVGAALTVTQQVFPLVAPGVQLHLDRVRGGGRRVRIVNHPPYPGEQESDLLVLGILINRLRQLASRPLSIPVVDLAVPEPPRREHPRWMSLLASPKVHFGARRSALHLSASDWGTPLRNADPRLLRTLKAMVGVDHRSSDALLVAVRALIVEKLPGRLTLTELAPALGLSRRSLQRKLADSEASLTLLFDEARRDHAEALVRDGLLTLGEVASRVGFDQQASFTRAWRRWFGAPPSHARKGVSTA